MFAGLMKGKHLFHPACESHVLVNKSYEQLLKIYNFFANFVLIIVKSTIIKLQEIVAVIMKCLVV